MVAGLVHNGHTAYIRVPLALLGRCKAWRTSENAPFRHLLNEI
jgi:hypothetical protein